MNKNVSYENILLSKYHNHVGNYIKSNCFDLIQQVAIDIVQVEKLKYLHFNFI